MTLCAATLLAAAVLLALGFPLLWNNPAVERAAKAFPRSTFAAVIFFGAGAAWFLYIISQLTTADFGDYKKILLMVFAAAGLAAFFYSKDFLAVRGAAILVLLAARPMLDASLAYAPPPESRVILNVGLYIAIPLAIYLGTMPFQVRDFFLWLFQRPTRPRALGAIMALYGIVLAVLATTYHNTY